MSTSKMIQYNAAIFPVLMSVLIKPTENSTGCCFELPRGAHHLYLSGLNLKSNEKEISLFEKYAYGVKLTDEDYLDIINFALLPVQRNTSPKLSADPDDILKQFGVKLCHEGEKAYFSLCDDRIDKIKSNTWDCIMTVTFSAESSGSNYTVNNWPN